jgi:NCS2 family nucleobase:cation symporter-2
MAIAARILGFWNDGADTGAARRRRPPVKPAELVYGVDESPPRFMLWMGALQHVLIATTVGMFMPLLVLDAAGASHDTAQNLMSICMLALGLGTVLLCLKVPGLGSGFLMPASFSGVYFSVSILAAKQGGLPLVAGMTMFAGLVQLSLSRVVHRLRAYLPTEIAGFTMLMSGLTLAVVGFNQITGVSGATDSMKAEMDMPALLGVACIMAMVALHVWGSAGVRTYIVLIVLAAGSVAAFALGMVATSQVRFSAASLLRLPVQGSGWPTFAIDMILPFAVAAIASSLRSIGDLTTAEKINDARWQRPDMRMIRDGLAANGLATFAAGYLGTVALGTTSGSVGASVATGVTSRVVGLATGALFLVFAFVPTISDLLMVIPRPVIGASLVFSSCFINMAAMQVMTSRLMDGRRVLVLGGGLCLAISRFLFPAFYADAPALLEPAVSSPLVIGLLGALLLNLVFRMGVSKSASIDFTPGVDPISKLEEFAERQGGIWGARRDVIERAVRAMIETAECMELLIEPGKTARVTMKFDEYWLDVSTEYEGKPLVTGAAAPSVEELLEDESQLTRLGAIMIRRQATRLTTSRNGTVQRINLGFEH